ncbi:hypothetical protein HB770_26830 (plasmid) [Rhizobium leguminosarum bv. viciae]|uniref:Uncharacterized protein n=1 Tax=Rhizobium leguminosarum bv. viciae TaxID=387 RepID=A0A7G6RMJ4_RHILV|nr:hypothetical protein HB770_26830 [Rhizobium leguminosarum bv. viciae]
MKRVAQDRGLDVIITDVSEKFVTIGIWGPNARDTLKKVVADPAGLDQENFAFAAIKPIEVAKASLSPPSASPMSASRAGNCT